MTSQAQALAPLEGVRGLVFFAFPLHRAGKPSVDRAAHLSAIAIPMLFLQGAADALADVDQLTHTVAALGDRVSLCRKDAEVLAEILDIAATRRGNTEAPPPSWWIPQSAKSSANHRFARLCASA